MPQRYFCGVAIPPKLFDQLNTLSVVVTGEPSAVRFPHVTILPPFSLKENIDETRAAELCSKVTFDVFPAHLSSLDIFSQHDRKILIAHVEPKEAFLRLNEHVATALEPYIEYDRAPYTDGKLPPYSAHTTLSYNAKTDMQPADFPKPDPTQTWTVKNIGLYKEMGPGVWEEVATKE